MLEEKTEANETTIDVGKLISFYISKWWVVVSVTLLAAICAFVYTANFVRPQYRASVMIYVNNSKSGENADFVSGTNLTAAQQLVNTYITIIRSDTVLQKVIEEAMLQCTAGELRGMISAKQVEETELFEVYVTNPDPEWAARIADAVAEIAPKQIEEFINGSSTKIVDYAKVPTAPFSPSKAKNTMIGALLGAILTIGIYTLIYLFDARIQDEEDLAAISTIPILGLIPDYSQSSASRKVTSAWQNASKSDDGKKGKGAEV